MGGGAKKGLKEATNNIDDGIKKVGKEIKTGNLTPIKTIIDLKFWNKNITFKNIRIFQRDDLFDINRIDELGRSNLQRMKEGLAPIGKDGYSINLHHLIQTNTSGLAEVQATFHQKYSSIIHINPNTIPSGINRNEFNKFRKEYWIHRANDFK